MSGRQARAEFLYEDDDIIAVDKPEGLPVIAAEGSRGRSLYDLVTARIQIRNKKGRAAVVHRLDRDTSGIVVFAKNARAKTALMGAWNELVKSRRYVAVVEGSPAADEGLLDGWLVEPTVGRVLVVPEGTKGALRALTDYRVLARGPSFSLVELELRTGRKHQIRAQLAALGHPVAGDSRYGSRSDPAGRLCLHATLLELELPYGARETRRFESPAPACFAEAVRSGRPGAPPGRQALHEAAPARRRPDAHGGTPRRAPSRGRAPHGGSAYDGFIPGAGMGARKKETRRKVPGNPPRGRIPKRS